MIRTITRIAMTAMISATAYAGSFGEYNAGDTFSLKVVRKETTKVSATGKLVKKVPVPTGVPNFANGQTVRFKIGGKGQLIARGMAIPFVKSMSSPGYTTAYFTQKPKGADSATVHKLTGQETDFAQVTFVRQSGTGAKTSVVTVAYVLEKNSEGVSEK